MCERADDSKALTIAMTLKNAAWSLERALNAISEAEYPKNRIKLVFVDGGSTDGSWDILKNFVAREKTNYMDMEAISGAVGITEGRNICLAKSVGDFVLFIDADVVVPPDIIRSIVHLFEANRALAFINVPCIREHEVRGYLDKIFSSRDESMGMSCAALRLAPLNKAGRYFMGTPIAENPLELTSRLSREGYTSLSAKGLRALHLKKSPATLRNYISVCFYSVPRLHLPLLKKGDVKTVAKYSFYSTLLISVLTSPLFWPLPAILLAGGVCYHLYRSKGNPLGLVFLFSGIVLVLGVLREVFRSIAEKS